MYRIAIHIEQIAKIREQLNAPDTPLSEINKPYMMRTVVFNRRIARLDRHEAAYRAKMDAGLMKWFNRVY